MPPLTPTPTSPGGPKQMPKWAWPVAIGGGLLIGFVLLRKTPEEYEEEQQEESPYPTEKGRGGGGSAIPFDDKVLEAFGLTPPTQEFQGSGTGDGFSGEGGEGAVTTDGGAVDNASFGGPATGSFQQAAAGIPGSSSSIFAGYGTTPGEGSKATGPGYPSSTPAPTPAPSGGSGSRSNLPQ